MEQPSTASGGSRTKLGPESGVGLTREMFDGADFWQRVHISSEDECWFWSGGRKASGYGTYYANRRSNAAHRVAYALEVAPVLPGFTVRHRCDTPPCVNPSHLVAGTQKQNVEDREERSRRAAPRGVDNGHAKLTEALVREIVSAVARGESQVAVARRLGVEKSTVGKIVRGESWKHVERPKPWQSARPGEVWLLTLNGLESAFYPSKSLDRAFTPVAPNTGTTAVPMDWPEIESGRRIWPEVAS